MPASSPAPARPRVVIVEDHQCLVDCLAGLLRTRLGLEVCGRAVDAKGGLQLVRDLRPDLLILDLTLAQGHGLELLKDLAQLPACPPTLVMSGHEEEWYAERSLAAGAQGYVRKTCDSATFLEAVRKVLAGLIHVSPEVTQRMLSRRRARGMTRCPLNELSDRELQVLEGIGQGHGTKEIAASMGIDAGTVDTYRGRLKDKLGLLTAHALAVYAFQWVHLGVRPEAPSGGPMDAPGGVIRALPGASSPSPAAVAR